MKNPIPISELEFLRITINHAEFCRKLTALQMQTTRVSEHARHIASCWFTLGKEHLEDAQFLLTNKKRRATYSRAYYAAYNASKALRYIVSGSVSLKGDDHSAASANLPKDLPEVASWSEALTQLYECRLHADYDNWADDTYSFPLDEADAVKLAERFLAAVDQYVTTKTGTGL